MKTFLSTLLFCAVAWSQQCGSMAVNPLTGKRDCVGVPGSGSGDVVGPASATDGHLAVFDTATGKLIKDGGAPPATSTTVNGQTCTLGGTCTVTVSGMLPLAGGTLAGNLLFTDNTYDIGAAGATRPRYGYFADSLVAGGNINTGGQFIFISGPTMTPQSTDTILFRDAVGSTFGRLQFGGTTSAFPALKRNGVGLEARLADDSNYTTFRASTFTGNLTGNADTVTNGMTQAVANSVANSVSVGVGTSGTAFAKTPVTIDPSTGAMAGMPSITLAGAGAAGYEAMAQGSAPAFGAGAGQIPTAGYFGWFAPTTLTASLMLVPPNTSPAANQLMLFPAPTSNVSQFAWTTVDAASSANTIARRNASNEVIAANTVATGKTPMATDTAVASTQMPALTGAVTSSAGTVATALAAPYTNRTCEIVVAGTTAITFALQAGDDASAMGSCYNGTGVTERIIGVYCIASTGTTTTVTPIIHGGGTILTGPLTCGNNVWSSTGTLSGTPTISSAGSVDGAMTEKGTAAWYHIAIVYTVPAS